jgi:hypothetical protein
VTDEESICRSAQETLNLIIDYNRETYKNIPQEEYESDKNLINEVSSINLITYLRQKNKVFLLCVVKPLTNVGITTLGELTQSFEFEMDEKLNKTMRMIMSAFPQILIDILKNSDADKLDYMLITPNFRKNVSDITVKGLQVTLKTVLKKTEELDFKNKMMIEEFDEENIINFRKNCKNPKLRNIYFRLIHNDFFTHVRMKKYKMTETDSCPRCGLIETTKHLLLECVHVRKIWSLYNSLMTQIGKSCELVNNFEEVVKSCNSPEISIVKVKVIQQLIQIERPMNWDQDKLHTIIRELINIEQYNANASRSIDKFNMKWKYLQKLL